VVVAMAVVEIEVAGVTGSNETLKRLIKGRGPKDLSLFYFCFSIGPLEWTNPKTGTTWIFFRWNGQTQKLEQPGYFFKQKPPQGSPNFTLRLRNPLVQEK
jgi:hypothetical protein